MLGRKFCNDARLLLAECVGDAKAFLRAARERKYSTPGSYVVTTEVALLIYEVWRKRLNVYADRIDALEVRKSTVKRTGDEVFGRPLQMELKVDCESPALYATSREAWLSALSKVEDAMIAVSFICGEVNLYMSRKRRSIACCCGKRGCACVEWLLDKLMIEGAALWRLTRFLRVKYVQYMRNFHLK